MQIVHNQGIKSRDEIGNLVLPNIAWAYWGSIL